VDLCRAIKAALPEMHLHAFSPEEILYGSTRSGLSIPEYLAELKKVGLGTLPGTSAEVLDQEIRDVIARGRITVKQWIEVITSAHAQGIRTTSTIMYGHVERPEHWVRHMDLLRGIQKETGGFTEFVPLSLIHQEAPMYRRGLVPGVRQGATGLEVVKMHAVARLFLGPLFRNIQCSWVKEGPKLAQVLLAAGCNDMGGTLINESISTSAGASWATKGLPSSAPHPRRGASARAAGPRAGVLRTEARPRRRRRSRGQRGGVSLPIGLAVRSSVCIPRRAGPRTRGARTPSHSAVVEGPQELPAERRALKFNARRSRPKWRKLLWQSR
jgi:CofH subfamily radical SAM domain protein